MSKFDQGFLDAVATAMSFAKTDMESLSIAAVKVAGAQGTVTADDVRAAVDVNRDKRIIGLALGHLKRRNVLYVVGYQATDTVESHGRPIFIFALTPHWKSGWPEDFMMPDGVSEGTALLDAREKEIENMKARWQDTTVLLESNTKTLAQVQRQVEELQTKTRAQNLMAESMHAALRDLVKEAKTQVITGKWQNMKMLRDAEAVLAGAPYPPSAG